MNQQNDDKTRVLGRQDQHNAFSSERPTTMDNEVRDISLQATGHSIHIPIGAVAPNNLGHPTPPPQPLNNDSRGHTVVMKRGGGAARALDRGDTVVLGRSEKHEALANNQYVTGWLVATTGPLKGKSYSLVSGNNYIGRSSSNQIVLTGDSGISGEAIIVSYDYINKAFYIQKGSHATQIPYIDNQPLLEVRKLEAGAIITLSPDSGDIEGTKLIFTPLCTENFSW